MSTQLKHAFEHCEPATSEGAKADIHRLKTPGGWIVTVRVDGEAQPSFFFPDPSHTWDTDEYVVRESL